MEILDSDFKLIRQHIVDVMIEVTVYDSSGNVIDDLYGIVNGGSIQVDSGSSVRRTASITLTPTKEIENINEKSLIWLNKNVQIKLGILDQRTRERTWYNQGFYVYENATIDYNASSNTLSVELSDYVVKLDGTVNGQVGGAITTVLPAYTEDPDTGEPIEYNSIKVAIERTLHSAGLQPENYEVSDVGEYYAMPEYNEEWEKYRERYPLWNMIPYDLEFPTGCSVWDIITELVELYPNYDAAFDADGKFIVKMIPSEYSDDFAFEYYQYVDTIISEQISVDLTTVKNVCEVWGESMDCDWFTDNVGLDDQDRYAATLDGYTNYRVGDRFGFLFTESSVSGQLLKVNDLPALPIINQMTQEYIAPGELDTQHIHIFYLQNIKLENDTYAKVFLYLGIAQSHGIDVLTDGTVVENGYEDPETHEVFDLYSQEFYEHVLNCDNVSLTVIEDSPFTVQKLGNRIDVKSDGEYSNITSDQLALERAQYENWKNSRLTDNVTITTKLMPFAEPYQKVSYKKKSSSEIEQFIIQSVSHDLDNGTTSITMYKFYPLYKRSLGNLTGMTYNYMGGYKNINLYGDEDEIET